MTAREARDTVSLVDLDLSCLSASYVFILLTANCKCRSELTLDREMLKTDAHSNRAPNAEKNMFAASMEDRVPSLC